MFSWMVTIPLASPAPRWGFYNNNVTEWRACFLCVGNGRRLVLLSQMLWRNSVKEKLSIPRVGSAPQWTQCWCATIPAWFPSPPIPLVAKSRFNFSLKSIQQLSIHSPLVPKTYNPLSKDISPRVQTKWLAACRETILPDSPAWESIFSPSPLSIPL